MVWTPAVSRRSERAGGEGASGGELRVLVPEVELVAVFAVFWCVAIF